jgi:hypothetical protein
LLAELARFCNLSPGAPYHNPVKKIEKWQTWTFVGSLAFLAILIHASQTARRFQSHDSPRYTDPPRQESTPQVSRPAPVVQKPPETVREKSPQELTAERARFIARYVTSSAPRNAGVKSVGIAVASEHRKLNGPLATFLAVRFTSPNVKALSTAFTPEFVSDGLLADAFSDSRSVIGKLDLANALDVLLLVRQSVEYSTNASLENVITANMSTEIIAVPTTTRGQDRTWTFRAAGAGFKTGDARALAEERIMKQITNDTSLPDTISAGQ